MKTLIVYYSHTANNEKLALELQRLLDCHLLKIVEARKRTGFTILLDVMLNRTPLLKTHPFSLNEYDHVVLVAPIWAGKIATPLKAFLLHEWESIREYSFITVCGGSQGQNEKLQTELAGIIHREPLKVAELRINDLLSPEQKGKIKYTSGHRVTSEELVLFKNDIQNFLESSSVFVADRQRTRI